MGNTQAILLDVQGEAPTNPEIRITPTLQRVTPTAYVGWKYQRRYSFTNSQLFGITNWVHPIVFGPTNTLVAGSKMLASGNDLRVWVDGVEIARTLNTINSATDCYIWVHIPFIAAGEVVVFDVVYGNSAAAAPPTLTGGIDLPAYDILATSGRSTKTFHKHLVEQIAANAGLGGAWETSGTTPPEVRFGVPGAWKQAATLIAPDDSWQLTYSVYTATGTKYHNRFDARRARIASLDQVSGFGSDGVVLHSDVPIVSVRADMRWLNQAMGNVDLTPIGKLVVLYRVSPGDDWIPYFSNNTLTDPVATVALTTYTFPTPAREVAFAIWPYDGFAIPQTAIVGRIAEASWYTTLEVTHSDVITQTTVEAEAEIYELATEVRYGGGGDTAPVPWYKRLFFGNRLEADGVNSPHLALKINEVLRVWTDTRKVEIWSAAIAAKVESAPFRTYQALEGIATVDGVTIEQASADWMPLRPQADVLTNPGFEVDASGWTQITSDALMISGALTRDAVVFSTLGPASVASGKGIVTGNTGGTGDYVTWYATDYLIPATAVSTWIGADLRTSNANLVPGLVFFTYDIDQVLLNTYLALDTYVPVINTFNRRIRALATPEQIHYIRIGVTAYSKTANQTGSIWIDNVSVNDTELALFDVNIGALTLDAQWLTSHAFA